MGKKKTNFSKEYDVLIANVRQVAKTRQGKELLWHILGMCNLYSDGFSGNSRTFYEEGKRSVGLEILAMLEEADPLVYPLMLLEKAKETQNKTVNEERND